MPSMMQEAIRAVCTSLFLVETSRGALANNGIKTPTYRSRQSDKALPHASGKRSVERLLHGRRPSSRTFSPEVVVL